MNNQIFRKLLYLSSKFHNLYSDVIGSCANSCGISRAEADVLLFFGNNPQFTNACDAVNYRRFSKAYVSKALSSLSKRNFITITANSNDRRYQQISINDCAKQTLEKLQDCQMDYINSLKTGISDEDFKTFIKVIDKIADNYLNPKKI